MAVVDDESDVTVVLDLKVGLWYSCVRGQR